MRIRPGRNSNPQVPVPHSGTACWRRELAALSLGAPPDLRQQSQYEDAIMDIDAIAKKIRQAIMDSAEDQGRTFNASVLDGVIAKELRANWPAVPTPPTNYPWAVVPMVEQASKMSIAAVIAEKLRNREMAAPSSDLQWDVIRDALAVGTGVSITYVTDDEWR